MIWNPKLARRISQTKGPIPWNNPADRLIKHASPIHPGTGTDQSVHGTGKSITLYRGEGSHDHPSYYTGPDSDMAGGYWTTDLESARRYAAGVPEGKVYVLEVDESEIEYRGLYPFVTDPEVRARRQLYAETDYRGSHQPSVTYGAPAHDLTHLVAEDIYTHPHYYMSSDQTGYRDSVAMIRRVRNNPDADVVVYRAVPKGVDEINPGDWVTPSREYAALHGESNVAPEDQDHVILSRTVKAKELIWPGDYLPEWGWFPENEFTKHASPVHPGTGTDQSVHGGGGVGVQPELGDSVTFLGWEVSDPEAKAVEVIENFVASNGEWTAPDGRRYYVQNGGIWVTDGVVSSRVITRSETKDGGWYGWDVHGLGKGVGQITPETTVGKVGGYFGVPGLHPSKAERLAELDRIVEEKAQRMASGPRFPDFAEFQDHWPDSFDSSVRSRTEQALEDVYQRMTQDPRWEDALDEWSEIGEVDDSVFDEVYEEAQRLQTEFNEIATEIIGEGWWDEYSDSIHEVAPWQLRDALQERTKGYGDDAEFFAYDFDDFLDGLNNNPPDWANGWGTTMDVNRDTWTIIGFNENTEKVQLQMQGELGRLLNPIDFKSEFSGSSDFPTTMWVPFETLHPMNEDYQWTILSEGEYNDLELAIDNLESDWVEFENETGVTPAVAEAYIDQGDYSAFPEGLGEMAESTAYTLVVHDSFNGTGTSYGDPDHPEELPRILRDLWSNTAADDHPWALAVQVATAAEFNISDYEIRSSHSGDTMDTALDINTNFGTMLKVWTRAVYEETQLELARRGWKMIPVARGQTLSTDIGMALTNETIEQGRWNKITDGNMNPLSSWTNDPNTARNFATHGPGQYRAVFRAWVPAEKVWGVSLLGNGAIKENELILLGGEGSFDGQIYFGDSYSPPSSLVFNE